VCLHTWEESETQAEKMFLRILIILFLPLFMTSSRVSAAEADRSPKGKPGAKADFVLTVKDNLISLDAKNASLKEILEEIGRKMKIEVLAGIPDTKKITAEFENLSIEEAINKLSTNYSYAMDSTNGERRITKIIVLEKRTETVRPYPRLRNLRLRKKRSR
jgi:hypothetical protein